MDRETKDKLVKLGQGQWAERDVLNIVEKVSEYDSRLKIQYCDEANSLDDAPYRLMELCRDGLWREVFRIWKLDETVLERIYLADTMKHDVQRRLDYTNREAKNKELRRYEEERAQVEDWLVSYLRSRKSRWSFRDEKYNQVVTLDDTPGMPVKTRPISKDDV